MRQFFIGFLCYLLGLYLFYTCIDGYYQKKIQKNVVLIGCVGLFAVGAIISFWN